MGVYLTDLANTTWIELGQPADVTIPEISFYLKNNLGKLNVLLFTDFTIDSSQEVSPFDSFTYNEANIYSKIYEVKYYNKKINDNLGAMSVDSVIEYSSDGTSIKKASRNETAKTYLSLRKDLALELKDLVTAYRIKKATPKDISGTEILQIVNDNHGYNRVIQ